MKKRGLSGFRLKYEEVPLLERYIKGKGWKDVVAGIHLRRRDHRPIYSWFTWIHRSVVIDRLRSTLKRKR